MYQRLFSLGGLAVLSLDTGRPTTTTPLPAFERYRIAWRAPSGGGTIKLSATSLRHPYRMDAIPTASSEQFSWPADILANRQISPADIGAVVTLDFGGTTQLVPVYLAGALNTSTENLRLVVRPSREMTTIQITAVSSRNEQVLDQELPISYYPAGVPIALPLRLGALAGLYRVRLTGTLRQGGTTIDDFTVAIADER